MRPTKARSSREAPNCATPATRSGRFACASPARWAPLLAIASLLPASPAHAIQRHDETPISIAPTEPGQASAKDPDDTETPATAALVSLGGSLWTGDFGGPRDNDIGVVLLDARLRTGDFRIGATLPWMHIRGDSTIFTGIDGTPLVVAPDIAMAKRERRGVGDLTIGAAWLALHEADLGFDLDLSGRVKLPTAAGSTSLSTGQTDYSIGMELSRSSGRINPVARVTYRVFGDGNGWTIRDGFAGSVGASMRVAQQAIVILSYDLAEPTSRFIAASHELVGGFSAPIARRLRLNGYTSVGLSKGAADFGTGVSLTYRM